jgi:predicted membrane protein
MENYINENKKKTWKNETVAIGLIVLTVGVLLMFRNLGLIERSVSRIIFSWEMLLIAIGFVNTLGRSKIWGVLMMLVGGVFMFARIYGVPLSFWQVALPSLIILVGVALLFSSFSFFSKRRISTVSDSDDVLEDVAVFAGTERSITSESFRGGKILAVFGGSKLNLTKVTLAPGMNELEIVCVFGGVSLIVPPEWNIKVEVFNIFGGYEDKRNPSQFDSNKTLVIKGVTVFGGGEVKAF